MHKRLLAMLLALALAMTSVLPAFAETAVPGDTAEAFAAEAVVTEPEQPAEEAPAEEPAAEPEVAPVEEPAQGEAAVIAAAGPLVDSEPGVVLGDGTSTAGSSVKFAKGSGNTGTLDESGTSLSLTLDEAAGLSSADSVKLEISLDGGEIGSKDHATLEGEITAEKFTEAWFYGKDGGDATTAWDDAGVLAELKPGAEAKEVKVKVTLTGNNTDYANDPVISGEYTIKVAAKNNLDTVTVGLKAGAGVAENVYTITEKDFKAGYKANEKFTLEYKASDVALDGNKANFTVKYRIAGVDGDKDDLSFEDLSGVLEPNGDAVNVTLVVTAAAENTHYAGSKEYENAIQLKLGAIDLTDASVELDTENDKTHATSTAAYRILEDEWNDAEGFQTTGLAPMFNVKIGDKTIASSALTENGLKVTYTFNEQTFEDKAVTYEALKAKETELKAGQDLKIKVTPAEESQYSGEKEVTVTLTRIERKDITAGAKLTLKNDSDHVTGTDYEIKTSEYKEEGFEPIEPAFTFESTAVTEAVESTALEEAGVEITYSGNDWAALGNKVAALRGGEGLTVNVHLDASKSEVYTGTADLTFKVTLQAGTPISGYTLDGTFAQEGAKHPIKAVGDTYTITRGEWDDAKGDIMPDFDLADPNPKLAALKEADVSVKLFFKDGDSDAAGTEEVTYASLKSKYSALNESQLTDGIDVYIVLDAANSVTYSGKASFKIKLALAADRAQLTAVYLDDSDATHVSGGGTVYTIQQADEWKTGESAFENFAPSLKFLVSGGEPIDLAALKTAVGEKNLTVTYKPGTWAELNEAATKAALLDGTGAVFTVTVKAEQSDGYKAIDLTGTFRIKLQPYTLAEDNITLSASTSATRLAADKNIFYAPDAETEAVNPTVTVVVDGVTMVESTDDVPGDYKLTYDANLPTGAAKGKVTVTPDTTNPKSRLTGEAVPVVFDIVNTKSLRDATITLDGTYNESDKVYEYTYKNGNIEPKVTKVEFAGGETLSIEDEEQAAAIAKYLTVTVQEGPAKVVKEEDGAYTVSVTATEIEEEGGNPYKDSQNLQFKIVPFDLKDKTVTVTATAEGGIKKTYNSEAQKLLAGDVSSVVVPKLDAEADTGYLAADEDIKNYLDFDNATCTDNTNAGTATAVVAVKDAESGGTDNYIGSVTINYTIEKFTFKAVDETAEETTPTLGFKLETKEYGETGEPIHPEPEVKAKLTAEKEVDLEETDYEFVYGEDCTSANSETSTVTLKLKDDGNYAIDPSVDEAKLTIKFTIKPTNVFSLGDEGTVTVDPIAALTFNGKDQKSDIPAKVVVKLKQEPGTTIENKHYDLSYYTATEDADGNVVADETEAESVTNAGKYVVRITGTELADNGWRGSIDVPFEVKPFTLTDANTTATVIEAVKGNAEEPKYTYNGEAIELVLGTDITPITVSDPSFDSSTYTFDAEKDAANFEIVYPDGNIDAGEELKFEIVGHNNFEGTVTKSGETPLTFKIDKLDPKDAPGTFTVESSEMQYDGSSKDPSINKIIYTNENGKEIDLTGDYTDTILTPRVGGNMGTARAAVNLKFVGHKNFKDGSPEKDGKAIEFPLNIIPFDISNFASIVNVEGKSTIAAQPFTGVDYHADVVHGIELPFVDSGKATADKYAVQVKFTKDKNEQPTYLTRHDDYDEDFEGDYVVGYLNNTKAGTATVVIAGINNYTGSITKTFKITNSDAKTHTQQTADNKEAFAAAKVPGYYVAWVDADDVSDPDAEELTDAELGGEDHDANLVYTADKQDPAFQVWYLDDTEGTPVLVEPDYYTKSYKNDINANDANAGGKAPTVTIKLKNGYTGTLTRTYSIKPANLAGTKITITGDLNFKSSAVKPAFTVTFNGKKVASGEYEKPDYQNNTAKRTGTVSDAEDGLQTALEALKDSELNDVYEELNGDGRANVKGGKDGLAYVLLTAKAGKNFEGYNAAFFNLAESIKGAKITFDKTSYDYTGEDLTETVADSIVVTQNDKNKTELYSKVKADAGEELAKVTILDPDGNEVDGSSCKVLDVGKYTVKAVGKPDKGYVGEVTKTFTIKAIKPNSRSNVSTADADAKVPEGYNGYWVVMDWDNYESEEPDAAVVLDDDKNPVYTGAKITLPEKYITVQYYVSGKAVGDPITTTPGATTITKVDFSNNINASTKSNAAASITMVGDHAGTVKAEFKIAQDVINYVALVENNAVATGSGAVKPKVNVYTDDGELIKASEYKVYYTNNTGKANGATIEGDGNEDVDPTVYIVSQNKNYVIDDGDGVTNKAPGKDFGAPAVKKCFAIAPKEHNLSKATVSKLPDLEFLGYDENGAIAVTQDFESEAIAVKVNNNEKLTFKYGTGEGKDVTGDPDESEFLVSYTNNTKAGTAKVTISGNAAKGYGGTKTVTFKIKPRTMTVESVNTSFAAVTDDIYAGKYTAVGDGLVAAYTGKAITLDTLKDNGKVDVKNGLLVVTDDEGGVLNPKTDYTVSYTNNKVFSNKKVGTAQIVIKGKGNYTGSIDTTFEIIAPEHIKDLAG